MVDFSYADIQWDIADAQSRTKQEEFHWLQNVSDITRVGLIGGCVPKIIDKTENEKRRMKQKQECVNWKVKPDVRKGDDSCLNGQRYKSKCECVNLPQDENNANCDYATNIKRKAKLLEESLVIKSIKENKNNFCTFVRKKRKDENNSERFKKQNKNLTKCYQETAEVLNSEFQKVFTKTGLLTEELKDFCKISRCFSMT